METFSKEKDIFHSKFNEICRTCMKTHSEKLHQIFGSEILISNKKESVKTSELLVSVSKLKMHPDDNFPKGICLQCLKCLTEAYNFQKMCIQSDQRLRNSMLSNNQPVTTYKVILPKFSSRKQVNNCQSGKNIINPSIIDEIVPSETQKPIEFLVVELLPKVSGLSDSSAISESKVYTSTIGETKVSERVGYSNKMQAKSTCDDDTQLNIELEEFITNYKHNIMIKDESEDNTSDNLNKDYQTEETHPESIEDDLKIKNEISSEHADQEIEKPNPSNRRNARHNCEECGKSFDRKNHYLRHLNVHKKDGRPFECKHCKKRFALEAHLQRHSIIHEKNFVENTKPTKNIDGHQCPKCPRKFLKQVSLASHMRAHRKEKESFKMLQCEECSKEFEGIYRLKRHQKTHEANHSCEYCGKTYGIKSHLIDHLSKHKGIKPHTCSYCEKSFQQACTLKDHLRIHTGEQPFLCSECGKAFNSASNLRQHQQRHSLDKNLQCPECPSKFKFKHDLLKHINTHSNEKPFTCDICGSKFTKNSSLAKHKYTHTGIKRYQCDLCEMRFTSSSHMKRHRRTHTGEKPYACKYCERKFAQSSDLIKHLRSHVGENIYQCEECDASFRYDKELKNHIAEHYKARTKNDNIEKSN